MRINNQNVSVIHNPEFPFTIQRERKPKMAKANKAKSGGGKKKAKTKSRQSNPAGTALVKANANKTLAPRTTKTGKKKTKQNPLQVRVNSAMSLFGQAAAGAGVVYVLNWGINRLVAQPQNMWGRAGIKAGIAVALDSKYAESIPLMTRKWADAGAKVFATLAILDVVAFFLDPIVPQTPPLFLNVFPGSEVSIANQPAQQQAMAGLVDMSPYPQDNGLMAGLVDVPLEGPLMAGGYY